MKTPNTFQKLTLSLVVLFTLQLFSITNLKAQCDSMFAAITSTNISCYLSNNGTMLATPEKIVNFPYTGTVQQYTVPAGVTTMTLITAGAGGTAGNTCSSLGHEGQGAVITSVLNVTPGDVLGIVVGQSGTESPNNADGGSGGTFVYDITNGNTLLQVGGGGGGGGYDCANSYGAGHNAGTSVSSSGTGNGGSAGGINGRNTSLIGGEGGAGWLGNGANVSTNFGGNDFANGLSGGNGGGSGGSGGYGGGGAGGPGGYGGGGGGGGYTGGGGGSYGSTYGYSVGGAGGTSYLNSTYGTLITATNGQNGNGYASMIFPSNLNPPYTYSWSTGSNANSLNNLSAGSYSVTISDANGCSATASVTITQPNMLGLTTLAGVWANVGTPGFSSGQAYYTSLAFNGTTPTVAYEDFTTNKLNAMMYIGGSWVPIGSPNFSGTYVSYISLAISNSSPYVAFQDNSHSSKASVMMFNGGSWVNVGAAGFSAGIASYTSLAFNGSTPYVAYQDRTNSNKATVMMYNGSWTAVGSVGFSANTAIYTSLAFNGSTPYVAFGDGGNSNKATVMMYNGSSWVNVGSPGFSAGAATFLCLAFNGSTPYVAYNDAGNSNNMTVMMFNGSSWVNVGAAGFSTGGATYASLVFNNSTPYVTYSDGSQAGNATVMSYNGSSWVPLGLAGFGGGGGYGVSYPCLAFSDSIPYVCFGDYSQAGKATVMQLELPNSNTCGNNGSRYFAASGGTIPYTYLWTPSGGTNSYSTTLSGGSYTITVTDANNCSATATVSISQPANPLAANATVLTNVDCNGNSTGSAQSAPSGGTSPYIYSWSSGDITSGISSEPMGNYTVYVTDANGCTATDMASITQPNVLTSSPTFVAPFCSLANGSASANVSGGTSPYTYLWTPGGSTNANPTGLSAGGYTVSVNDSNNCSTSASVSITQPIHVYDSITSFTNVTCNGANNGSAIAGVKFGTTPYTYSWIPGGQNAPSVSNLSAGTYTIIVTGADGCPDSATATITEPNTITPNASVINNVRCNGYGNAQVNPTGGTSPYTYSWVNASSHLQSTSNPSGTVLTAGSYTVSITDVQGCSATASVIITKPGPLTTTAHAVHNVLCKGENNGDAMATPSGGLSPYTYSWFGASSSLVATSNPTGGILSIGTYTVSVHDSCGLSATAKVNITQPGTLQLALSETGATCYGENNGSAQCIATGGTIPYSYAWSSGETASGISNKTGGTYTITVTDANNCSATGGIVIAEPSQLRDSIKSGTLYNISCNGGNNGGAKVGVKGGISPYTYSWAPASGTNANLSNLSAGTYSVYITDKNNCSASIIIVLTQPGPIRDSVVSSASPFCYGGNDGIAVIGVKDGASPYTYIWTPNVSTKANATGLIAGGYTVEVKDKNQCMSFVYFTISQPLQMRDSIVTASIVNVQCNGGNNGSAMAGVKYGMPPYTYLWSPTGGTQQTGTGLSAGSYTVNVMDNNGCTGSVTVTIIQQYNLLRDSMVSATTANISCNGGSNGVAKVGATGGKQPYTYSWTPVSTTTANVNGLSAGTYSVFVTDLNGCSASASITLTQPALIRDSLVSSTLPSCNGGNNGAATLGVKGGVSPYTYIWTPHGGTLATAAGLSAGSYTVEIKDQNHCIVNFYFSLTQPLALRDSIVAATKANILCNGSSTGSATVGTKFGTGPYTYLWSPGGGTNQKDSVLSAGTYTITITDANGCTGTTSTTITQPSLLRDSVVSQACSGSNGSATIGVKGGTSPYKYGWSPGGGTKATMTGLSNGTYTITVSDKYGCSQTTGVTFLCGTAPPRDGPIMPDTCCPGQDLPGIKLYPNPNTGEFRIEGVQPGQIVQLYDYTGKLLKTETAGNSTILLNISNQANGVYMVRILSKDGVLASQKKVVKTQ